MKRFRLSLERDDYPQRKKKEEDMLTDGLEASLKKSQ